MAPTLPPQAELASLFQRLFQPQPLLKMAHRVGFVVRQRKLQPVLFALALTVATLSKERKTYKQIVADMHSVGGQLIAPQSLQQRLSLEGAAFLLEVLRQPLRLLADSQAPTLPQGPDWLMQFSEVWATDSTVFGLPSALAALFPNQGGAPGSAGMKLHLSLDVLGAQLRGFRFEAGRAPEGLAAQVAHHPPSLLHLLDKGFGKSRPLLYQIDGAQQFFITPLWVPMPLYDERGNKLDAEQLCRACEATGKLDVWVYLGNPRDPQDQAVRVRLVGARVPEVVAAQRRRRAHKEAQAKGHAVKARTLRLMAWTLLVTNVPKNQLTPEQVLLGYRLRWQVELMFLRWKHLYGMRAPGYKKPESLYCHLIATLVAAAMVSLIQRVMFRQWDPTHKAEPSPYQITALFVGQGDLWLLALGGTEDLPFRRQLLERLLLALVLLGRMEKRQRVSSRRSLLIGGHRIARSSRRNSSLT
jgi:Transposase DDE domain